MEEKGGRSGRGGQREEGGNKHPFAREQSSQIQLMVSPGRPKGGQSLRFFTPGGERTTHHKDQRRFGFIALLEKKYTTKTFNG